MTERTNLSVLTLNCWGLKFSENRRDRVAAIGHHLSDASLGYDIVGLQEVWLYEDFLLIRNSVKNSLPFSKHWFSGLFGSGLVIFSKHPILNTSLRRYALSGDPRRILHGDWFDGKSCASAVIVHPLIGEIQLHATYNPVVSSDEYLGCRLGQAWEMAQLIRTAVALGRHVIALGDFNSAPESITVQLITRYAGLSDSWESLHPVPRGPTPRGLSPEEGIALLGITCDTPLNYWTRHATWPNRLTGDPIGERLDYIFFKSKPEMRSSRVRVAFHEKIDGIGGSNETTKHMSDHFAVHSVFSVSMLTSPSTLFASQQANLGFALDHSYDIRRHQDQAEGIVELLERVLAVLEQHLVQSQVKSTRTLTLFVPTLILATLSLLFVFTWIDWREAHLAIVLPLAIGLSIMSSCWVICVFYGFFYGRETASAFTNIIQEVQAALDYHREGCLVCTM